MDKDLKAKRRQATDETPQEKVQRVEAIRNAYTSLIGLLTDASYDVNGDGTLAPDHPIRMLHENAHQYYKLLNMGPLTPEQQADMDQRYANAVGLLNQNGALNSLNNDDLKNLVKGVGAIVFTADAMGAGPYIEPAQNLGY